MDFIKRVLNPVGAETEVLTQRAMQPDVEAYGRAEARLRQAEKARQLRLTAERQALEAQARKAAYDAETQRYQGELGRARNDAQSARIRRQARDYDNRDGAAMDVFGRRVAARDRGNYYNQSMDRLGLPLPRLAENPDISIEESDARHVEDMVSRGIVDPRNLSESQYHFNRINDEGVDGYGAYKGNQIVSGKPASFNVGQYGIYPIYYSMPQPFQFRQATPEESTAIPRMNNAIQRTFTQLLAEPSPDPPRRPRKR